MVQCESFSKTVRKSLQSHLNKPHWLTFVYLSYFEYISKLIYYNRIIIQIFLSWKDRGSFGTNQNYLVRQPCNVGLEIELKGYLHYSKWFTVFQESLECIALFSQPTWFTWLYLTLFSLAKFDIYQHAPLPTRLNELKCLGR